MSRSASAIRWRLADWNGPITDMKTRLERIVDYRNRAEELRIVAEGMRVESQVIMLSTAASYDVMANTLETIIAHTAYSAD